ncbi:MAG TPA: carbohydrate binding domain-containing protein [Ktedonobacteraceae bacterium]
MHQRTMWLICATVLVVVSLVAAVATFAAARPARAASSGIPGPYFAPYTDITLDHGFAQMAQNTTTTFFSLGFVVDNTNGSCQATWAGSTPVTGSFMLSDISTLRANGGDVIPSFGGAANNELALDCTSVSALQAQYQAVIHNYGVTHLDFDIEGSALDNSAANDRRNQAIAALQQAALNAGSQLALSYTLPVTTSGLLSNSLNLLRNAVSHAVNISMVNIMVMDYFDPASAPGNQMGQNAINAANATFSQLQSIFPGKSASQLWAMIGLTPMVGENDDTSEVFSEQDARQVLAFAQQQHLGELSFWSVQLDVPCTGGKTPTNDCSGVTQQPYDYAHIFAAFNGGTGGPTPTPTPTHTPTPTPTPTATPGPGGNLVSNPGFETGNLSGWVCDSGDAVVLAPAHTGSHALQLTPGSATTGECDQTITLLGGHTYTLSAFVNGPYAFLGIQDGASNWTISSSYTLLSVTFTTGASQTSVTIYLHGWYGQANVFVDDVSLQ